jgi:hypothetical protein
VHYCGGNRAHYNSASPQTAQLFEQLLNFLFEQKNTIPKGLNSYNFDAGLDYNFTTGSKHPQRLNCPDKNPLPRQD